MYPHRIRLRGPWECTPEGQPARRATVPCRLADFGSSPGQCLFTRQFGYPGRIDAHERVWLTVDDLDGLAAITLNGQLLGKDVHGPFAADVTAILAPHNRLEILMRGRQIGEVAMEIRATAFLEGVKVQRTEEKLIVEGHVAGTCDRPLELYLLVDGRNAFYRTINAGEFFAAVLEKEGQIMRAELVNVSTVWYALELPVPP